MIQLGNYIGSRNLKIKAGNKLLRNRNNKESYHILSYLHCFPVTTSSENDYPEGKGERTISSFFSFQFFLTYQSTEGSKC